METIIRKTIEAYKKKVMKGKTQMSRTIGYSSIISEMTKRIVENAEIMEGILFYELKSDMTRPPHFVKKTIACTVSYKKITVQASLIVYYSPISEYQRAYCVIKNNERVMYVGSEEQLKEEINTLFEHPTQYYLDLIEKYRPKFCEYRQECKKEEKS